MRVDDDLRRRNITLSVAPQSVGMLKEIARTRLEGGKRVPEGRLFDGVIETLYFETITLLLRRALPEVGFSTSEPVTWSTDERYVSVAEIDSDSIRFSFVEYDRAKSVRADLPLSIPFIVDKLIVFLRNGLVVPEIAANAWEFPAHPRSGDAIEVQVVFYREGSAPVIVPTVGDSARPSPTVGSYVIVKDREGTKHGSVTNVNYMPAGAMVVTADLSDLELMEV
jgi:hypothetical protein